MDVLIVERDDLAGSALADTLDAGGILATVASDEEALELPTDDAPRLVITGINRGHDEDLTGLKVVAAMRRKWPQLCVLYLAALWPARFPRERLTVRERFLAKPVRLAQMIRTVRELLDSGLCQQPGDCHSIIYTLSVRSLDSLTVDDQPFWAFYALHRVMLADEIALSASPRVRLRSRYSVPSWASFHTTTQCSEPPTADPFPVSLGRRSPRREATRGGQPQLGRATGLLTAYTRGRAYPPAPRNRSFSERRTSAQNPCPSRGSNNCSWVPVVRHRANRGYAGTAF
jgi:hypothetical protein